MKDCHGNEWVFLPRSMLKLDLDPRDCMGFNAALDRAINSAIAAAPKFEAVEVDDAVCERVTCGWFEGFGARTPAESGRDMIAAVRAELGPTLGLVTREEMAANVESAYREGLADSQCKEWRDGEYIGGNWQNSNARRAVMWPKGGGS